MRDDFAYEIAGIRVNTFTSGDRVLRRTGLLLPGEEGS